MEYERVKRYTNARGRIDGKKEEKRKEEGAGGGERVPTKASVCAQDPAY